MRDWTPSLSGHPLEAPDTVLDPIARWFAGAPDHEAVVSAARTVTYGELDEASARIAGAILDAGVRGGEPVVVHTGASVWAIAAMIGVLRAGACFAVVDAAFPPMRRAWMAEAARAHWALVEPGTESETAAAALTELGLAVVDTMGAAPASATVTPAGTDPAYLCFTSGSTGKPKAVVVDHDALAHSTMARLAHYPEPMRGFVLGSSLSFDSAYAGIFWALAAGGTLLIPSTRPGELLAIAQMTADPRASHTLLVPSLYSVVLSSAVAARAAGLTAVIVAGEACPPSLVRRHFEVLPDVGLYNEYGPTETTVWATVHRCTLEDGVGEAVPIGGPIPGVRLYVRAPDATAAAAGELWIGGPTVAAGYRGGTAADHVRFRELDGERCYRTGDLVSLTAAGSLVYQGRADRQIKLAGVRLEIEEIEEMLIEHPEVTEAALGTYIDNGRTVLVAVVAGTATVGTLRTHLLAALPAGAVPAGFVFVDAVPRQPNGKLDRRVLDDQARDWITARRASEGV